MRTTISMTLVVVFIAIGMSFFGMFMIFPMINFGLLMLFVLPILSVFVFIALAMTKGIKQTHQDTHYVTCPHCMAATLDKGAFCSHCGKPLEDIVICDYCGATNKVGAIQCEKCQALL